MGHKTNSLEQIAIKGCWIDCSVQKKHHLHKCYDQVPPESPALHPGVVMGILVQPRLDCLQWPRAVPEGYQSLKQTSQLVLMLAHFKYLCYLFRRMGLWCSDGYIQMTTAFRWSMKKIISRNPNMLSIYLLVRIFIIILFIHKYILTNQLSFQNTMILCIFKIFINLKIQFF